MQSQSTNEVVETFLGYFRDRDHLVIPGSSILPNNDPTLLFINSGMAPLKPYFTGAERPPHVRCTDVQHCIRTVDLEDVGDSHHGTSFRMMGSWSFGSYFKEEAIELAFRLITEGFGFDAGRLYATVYGGDRKMPDVPADQESESIWQKFLPSSHIFRRPAEDNFWGPAGGVTGPCGPCTEIFFDRGEEYGQATGGDPLVPGRFIEIWNAGVFMEYFRNPDGTLDRLPLRCVDTGAGLERFAMILQDVASIYDIDQYLPAYRYLQDRLGNVRDSRIVLDHLKTSLMMMSEGVRPSSQREGYVLRQLLRRVLTVLSLGNMPGDTIVDLATAVSSTLDQSEAVQFQWNNIRGLLAAESTSFGSMLKRSRKDVDRLFCGASVSAPTVVVLKTTLGVPLELLKERCFREGHHFPEGEVTRLLKEHAMLSKR